MLAKSGFGSSSSRGFGYKPRSYGLSTGLQSQSSRRPAYYGAGISGSLLGQYGNPGMGAGAGIGSPVPQVTPRTAQSNLAESGPRVNAGGAGGGQPAPAAAGGAVPMGWTDPTIARIMAFNSRNREMARAQATAARKQLAIDYGDSSISGDLAGDETTSKAAKENPFSVLALLRKRYEQEAPRDLDEGYNQANLFFSGARAKGLGDLANEYQQQQSTSDRQARGALSEIEGGLLEALMAADYADMQAQWNQGYPQGGVSGNGAPAGAPPTTVPGVEVTDDGVPIDPGGDAPPRPAGVGPDWIWEGEYGHWVSPDGTRIVRG